MSVRFYSPEPPVHGRLTLEGDEAKHLARVCRLGVGDLVEIFDGRGSAFTMEVTAIAGNRVELLANGPPLAERLSPFPLTLATAFPKGDRLDWLIEKATELGVTRVIPLITERSVVDPRASKIDRLRRSIVEASKQCRRNRLMELDDPTPWPRVAQTFRDFRQFIADFDGASPHRWPAILIDTPAILAIGPEGGFTSAELEFADRNGWIRLQLGVNILRVETAAIAGSAALFTRAQAKAL